MKKKNILIISVVILLLAVVLFVGYIIFFKDKEYKTLENNMEDVVSKYLGQYIGEYPENGEKKIFITDVIKKGYEIDMNANGEKCAGYVVVKKVSFAYEYDGYIKCDNYTTKGYEDESIEIGF